MPPAEAQARVEIEQEHIDRAEAIARHLARTTTLGRVAGEDEMCSEVQCVLWELALEFDSSLGVPFTAFISLRVRHRLIDWLRNTYGRERPDGTMPPRLEATLTMASLDTFREQQVLTSVVREHPALVDSSPGVEETVLDRDEVRRLGEFLREGNLTTHQLRSLMWPVYEGTPSAYMGETGKSKVNISAARKQAKQKAAEHLDRELKPNYYSEKMRRWLLDPSGARADRRSERLSVAVTLLVSRPATVHLLVPETTEGSVSDMDGRRKGRHTLARVDDEQLLAEREHMTLQEIGDRHGVSASAVCHRLRKMGATGVRPRYSQEIPWRVAVEHTDDHAVASLRALGAYRAGKTLDRYDQRLVERFVQRMVAENLVIAYDREDGFFEVQRDPVDIGVHPYYEQSLLLGTMTRLAG